MKPLIFHYLSDKITSRITRVSPSFFSMRDGIFDEVTPEGIKNKIEVSRFGAVVLETTRDSGYIVESRTMEFCSAVRKLEMV
jgi:hypothetical protein